MSDYKEFTIVKDNKIVSRISFKNYCRNDICDDNPGVYVRDVYTLEGYRNMGFASELIGKLIKYSKINDIKYILLDDCTDVPKNRNLYCKLCFSVEVDDNKWVLWSEISDDYIVGEERVYFVN